MKILVLHPKNWKRIASIRNDIHVEHVSIGGPRPARLDGSITFDGIGEKITKEGIDNLFKSAKQFRPDVFLFGIHFGLSGQMVQCLKDTVKCKTVMHYTDQRVGLPTEVGQYKDCLDLLLLTNQDSRDHFKYNDIGLKTETFYDGVSLDEYYPKAIKPRYDCIFGGNNYQGIIDRYRKQHKKPPPGTNFPGGKFRQDFIQRVDKMCRLQIYGKWGWGDLKLRSFVQPMLFHPRYIDLLRSGNLILNTYNVRLKNLYTRRLFRSMASGRPYVTQYVNGMCEDFKDGENIIWFKTILEGLDKIKFYLNNHAERRRISRNAVELIQRKHTWQHRLDEFVELCKSNL